ncbi:hypothetical protein DAEQUDRAFT_702832 [Daedalea quercina L-15889]|uniref:Calcium permease n=1 Tax=Daedalea quercina L-15889 TaxID=1314783 RepID=A0A165TRT8_9APHY|nr:hypothetical protein DAEQUDRAFT_702832 [Daedalea quercina L-15889]
MSSAPGPDDEGINSSPVTPSATPTTSAFAHRLPLHRSVSRSSQWSVTDTPRHHHQGTSYFPEAPRPVSPTPKRTMSAMRNASVNSRRRPVRSASLTSSHATTRAMGEDPGTLSEAEEDEESGSVDNAEAGEERVGGGEGEDEDEEREDDPITLKDRQSLINVEHPFGLPIWKPALYKKSRSVTRYADQALHSVPSAQAERHLLPGNILWTLLFGWWLALSCIVASGLLYLAPRGGRQYATLMFGLGWYIAWPFGKYVEGDLASVLPGGEGFPPETIVEHPDEEDQERPENASDAESTPTGHSSEASHDTITPGDVASTSPSPTNHPQAASWNDTQGPVPTSATALLGRRTAPRLKPSKSYGATDSRPESPVAYSIGAPDSKHGDWLGRALFRVIFICVIAPLMLLVSVICWGIIFAIPMARLNWMLVKYLVEQPLSIRFCAAPAMAVAEHPQGEDGASSAEAGVSFKPARLAAGQTAPFGSPTSTVLLCTYKAFGWKYYKYTVGGVNIIFVNLMPIVFFVIFDGFVLLRLAERRENAGEHVPAVLAFLTSRALIFLLSLASVIPLSYFIGMAVASISAQSSIGMGAVINATFGSIIEILLYCIALTQGKGHLVEGSIIGSILAGVLLMPGSSMCGGAVRTKEQKFNAKSAGVTSMLLIMAIIGTLAPTLFYQTYGNFQLVCEGCPPKGTTGPWACQHCYYKYPDPVDDPFYQSTVKTLMYFCAGILLLSYLIGLWFSLRTHASQIWQNPQQLLHQSELAAGQNRMSLYHRLVPAALGSASRPSHSLSHKSSQVNITVDAAESQLQTPTASMFNVPAHGPAGSSSSASSAAPPPPSARRVSYAPGQVPPSQSLAPLMESVDTVMKDTGLHPTALPDNITTDDFTRAVAVATVSALRHQHEFSRSPARMRMSAAEAEAAAGHGGHDAPSWSRTTSASVLLGCTALYAIIAELLVDVVDVVLEGSGIDEKFLGVTLFALVPNTTEFMNALSFAMNGNISLSMEIGSAYALQVCLLQIPAMVAFSAWYAPEKMGAIADTFTLIFPRWDVIVIILSVFLLTYTYIEAKSNYHRGSILILSYLVLVSGFFFAPRELEDDVEPLSSVPLSFLASFFYSR